MGGSSFGIALAIGAALLAAWVDMRLERKRPGSPGRCFAHAATAFAVVQGTTTAAAALAGSETPRLGLLAVLFGIVLPGLVYAFLAGLWLMRTLAEVARLSRR